MSFGFLAGQNCESDVNVSSPPCISVLLSAPYLCTDPPSSSLSLEDSLHSTAGTVGINFDELSVKNSKEIYLTQINNCSQALENQSKSLVIDKTEPNSSEHAMIKVENNQILKAACRIQSWWRRILHYRKFEEAAIRRLLTDQKKRILNRSTSLKSSTPLNNRTRRSPRVASVIMKNFKNSELFVRSNRNISSQPSMITVKKQEMSPLENKQKELNERSFSNPLVESGSKSPEEGSKAADLMQAIIADLEKLGAVQSELVLHNGKRLDEHAQSAETLQKINQLLKGVQTKAKTGDNEENHCSTIDQVEDSLKSLSEVKYQPINSRPFSANPNADFNRPNGRDLILSPMQLCPLKHDSWAYLPASKEEMAIFEGEVTFDHQDDSKVPAFRDDNSDEAPVLCQNSYISQFEQELAEQRRCIEKQQAEEMEQALQDCEKRLREEYETKLEKNYHLIEQLIAEKKELTEQCDKLVSDMRQMSEKALAKQKLMEENHKVELKKVEAKAVAAEKIKRERWEAAKTKSIKELAAKGVERDIQRMMTNHKEEIEELNRYYKKQLEAADAHASEQYSQKVEEFRLKLAKEREEICAQERKLVAERYEALLEEERQVWDNLRTKLLKEGDEEKERVMNQAARERTEFEEQISRLNVALAEASQKQLQDMERMKKEMREEYEADLLKLQTRLESEKAGVEEEVRNQLEKEFQEREREIADKLRKERDSQLEAAIQRLEEESSRIRGETENSAQEKIKRLKEKYQKDIDDLEAAEREAKEKYNQMRAQCVELEGEMSCQTVRMTHLTEELCQIRAKNDQLNSEREQLREVLTREIEVELAVARASATRAQCEAAETRAQAASKVARLQAELNATKRGAAEELESLHQKIKEAIVKKDAKVAELIRSHEKEVRELHARLNTRAIYNNNSAFTMDGESRSVGPRSSTSGCAKRGVAKTRVAGLRGR